MKMSLDNSNGRKEPLFTQIYNLGMYLDLMLEIFIYYVRLHMSLSIVIYAYMYP